MQSILVTGGAGYIGTELTEQLLELGHRVICLDRVFFGLEVLQDFLKHPNYMLVREDVRTFDPTILNDVDAVMDLAAISNDPACDLDPKMTEDINWRGSYRVAELAKAHGVKRFIFSSSCSVYGHGSGSGLTEDDPLAPVSLYAKCKIRSEEDLHKLNDDKFTVTILRNATVYGSSRRMRYDLVVNLMTAKAFHDGVIYVLGGGQQWRPNVHVRDVGRAFIHILNQPTEKVRGRVFNVGSNNQTHRVIDIANMVRDVMPTVRVEIVPDDPDKRNYNVNFDRIQNELGFKTNYHIPDAVADLKQRLTRGTIRAFNDPRTKTLDYYSWLIRAKETLDDVTLGGKLF
jgi:nucleoside-diphosphate-sugar epimerase